MRVKGGEVEYVLAVDVDYIDVSAARWCPRRPRSSRSSSTTTPTERLWAPTCSARPPLVRAEAPLVGTGMEYRAAVDSGDVVIAEKAGVVTEVSADLVTVAGDDGTSSPTDQQVHRSNQGNSYNQRVIVSEGQRVEVGIIADGPATDGGEMALGRNLLVAFMPGRATTTRTPSSSASAWCRTTSSPRSTSRSTRSTPATPSSAPRRSPGTSRTSPRTSWPTSTSAGSSASVPRSATATSSSARSRPRARPS